MMGIKQVVNPQRWNRYAYVVNNPLALYDPDGQDDEGQGGGKIIDVFIAMPPNGQQDYRTVNGRPAGNYPPPDWGKLQENAAKAGYTVNVHQLSESTPEAVANSFKNAELTVIVGHGIDLDPQNPNKFTADAAAISGGLVSVGGIQPATAQGGLMIATGEATPVSGTGVVGLFTCNSTDVLSSGFPNQTVVSNDGGSDGLTTVGTLQQSAFGFVGTYVDTGGNVNAAAATGQRVINNASNRVVNDPAANGARATNAGDTLHIRVRRREEE